MGKMAEITEEVINKLKEVSGIKSVELYAGQLDEPERYRSRMPGILLVFRENPFDKSFDYEIQNMMRYSAILLYSNKRSPEEQVMESLDIMETMMNKLSDIRGIKFESMNPVDFNKAYSSFEIQFGVKKEK